MEHRGDLCGPNANRHMKIWTHKYIRATRAAHRVLAEMTPEDVGSVAVIKHAALEDMVLPRPFFVAARQNFPMPALRPA